MRRTQDSPYASIPYAYIAISALITLASARLFYSCMLLQTHGEWSAPLDDVFIHFDYARATARGYPFQWSEGNGFSSGNTSLTYPFVLALGYRLGFQNEALMTWAAVVASISVLGFLWAASPLFYPLPAWTRGLAPVALFSIGALGWSLWSGMEVAFFLGLWGAALAIAFGVRDGGLPLRGGGWLLGFAGALLVTTRPEGATSLAVLGVFAAIEVRRKHGLPRALATLCRAATPAALALVGQSIANRIFTGELSANGAIVKLALYQPYMNIADKIADYRFNLRYAFDRVHMHHFGDPHPLRIGAPGLLGRPIAWGFIPLGLAMIPLFDKRTRSAGALLLSSSVLWTALVSLNGQVRWQNERYLMPAVAWLLLSAALGLGVLLAPTHTPSRAKLIRSWQLVRRLGGVALALGAVCLFWPAERIQYRDQVWFFGRASRNIYDQHITVGRMLRHLAPRPSRVLVGDAGAIVYASDLPAFDLIGLGGYHDLPLARAGIHGLGATLELLERLPAQERPDIMAIYPSWWGPLPDWFGHPLLSVPVRGNVICGGAEKVIYQADWHLLGTGDAPRSLQSGWALVDEIDMGDLISEREHDYQFSKPHSGYVDMRVLPDPSDLTRDLWDAGRHIPEGRTESMLIKHLTPGKDTQITFRTTADLASEIELSFGSFHTTLNLPKALGWREYAIEIPGRDISDNTLALSITARREEWTDYHIWIATRIDPSPAPSTPPVQASP